MESYRSNTFTIKYDDDLIKLTKIEVMRDGNGNDWYLDNVSFKLPV